MSTEAASPQLPACSIDLAATISPPLLTDAERWEMIQSVEGLIVSAVIKARVPRQDRDDFIQDLKLALWGTTLTWKPARGVKWSTYACVAIARVLKDSLDASQGRLDQAYGEGSIPARRSYLNRQEVNPIEPDTGEPDEIDPDQLFEELGKAVHEQVLCQALQKLGPGMRRYIEMIVLDGLTVQQIADQLGFPRQTVVVNLQNAIKRLGLNGGKPVRENGSKYRPSAHKREPASLVANGVKRTFAEWSQATGLSAETIRKRIQLGWTPERAVSEAASPHGRLSDEAARDTEQSATLAS